MLNNLFVYLVYLLSIQKNKIKKINNEKITFYNFNVLNATNYKKEIPF
jgi:hypothetical protein